MSKSTFSAQDPAPHDAVTSFNLSPTKSGGISCMAKTSKDLDVLQDIISDSNEGMVIQKGLQNYLETKLKLPIDIDFIISCNKKWYDEPYHK